MNFQTDTSMARDLRIGEVCLKTSFEHNSYDKPNLMNLRPSPLFRRIFTLILTQVLIAFSITAQIVPGFGVSDLSGTSSFLATSLQFGPDDRLYVAQQDGMIKAYTIVRLGPNNYIVTDTEDIDIIQQIPNHDDDGTPNPSIDTRQITGIFVEGSASNPLLWVTSSDPRAGAGPLGTDVDLDTNSGIISLVEKDSSGTWVRTDIIRGLPRSEENHATNGLLRDTVNNVLLVCQGGNTNQGARSNNFALAPEYAYSAAILIVYLDSISSFPYDLPTLDDEDRPGVNDFNDPFGGNDGKNQAMLEVGGPVQVYSPGWRNPYDILLTESGRLYSWDNGPNAGWGAYDTLCRDTIVEGGGTVTDGLHLIPGPGYYAGHPNVIRGNRANTFNPSNPQSPVPAALENPIECTYLEPLVDNDAIVLHPASSNGLTEYTASNFGGLMKGLILMAAFDGKIMQVALTSGGDSLLGFGITTLFNGFGSIALDVIAMGDSALFPGTVWTANIFGGASVSVFEPNDYDGGTGAPCDFSVDSLDADMDGYTNLDEISNATNPCSAGSKPDDFDHDNISDLLDPDDDNDGIPDVTDAFAIDSLNGSNTYMPLDYDWEPGDAPLGGFFNLGFTGLMNNGITDYLDQFVPEDITAGGTAGLFTIDKMTAGGSKGMDNTQMNAFQFGVNVDTTDDPFVVQTRIRTPFSTVTPTDFQSMGFFIGEGNMDNYAKLVIEAGGGTGGIEYLQEVDTTAAPSPITKSYPVPGVLGSSFVDLFMTVDPVLNTVQAAYSINGGLQIELDGPRTIPASWTDSILAIGIIGTSFGSGVEFPATWDYIKVYPLGPVPSATLDVFAGNFLNSDVINPGAFNLTNTSNNAGDIVKVTIDLSAAIQQDFVFDPTGAAGDNAFKDLVIDFGADSTGFLSHSFDTSSFHDGGYDRLIMEFDDFEPGENVEFSIDIDPTSIQGLFAPGPNNSGKVSGPELTGAHVDIEFDNGTVIGGDLFHTFGTFGGSFNTFDEDTLVIPSIEISGLPLSPSSVGTPNHNLLVTATPGSTVKILQAEGGMFLGSNPGFDIDPFESNSIIKLVEHSVIIPGSGVASIPVTLELNDVNGGINHFVAALDGGSKTSFISNKLIVQYDLDTTYSAVSINCGGPSYTAVDGTEFIADQFFSSSSVFANTLIPDIFDTDDDLLYQTERNNVNFNYEIPVQNGDYIIKLHFAEIFFGATSGGLGADSSRIFDVSVEGALAIANLDLYAIAGAETALVFNIPVSVSDTLLNIDFSSIINKAKISAIQVIPDTIEVTPTCAIPSNLMSNPFPTAVQVTWNVIDSADSYVVEGRRIPSSTFRAVFTVNNFKSVGGLKSERAYEWRVAAVCGSDTSDFSAIDTFITPPLRILDGDIRLISNLSLSPNPASASVTIQMQSNYNGPAELKIIGLAGNIIESKSYVLALGINTFVLEKSGLPSGTYLIELSAEGYREIERLQVIGQ